MVTLERSAVVVARFRWWHLDQVLPLERVLFPHEPWGARLYWSELGQVDTRHYVVALDGQQVVGWAGLCDYPDVAFVQTMAVDPAGQGRGVGRRLLDDLLAESARRGHRTTALEVRADNAPAQALYARAGFTRTGVRRGYYKGPDGPVDALVLEHRRPGGGA